MSMDFLESLVIPSTMAICLFIGFIIKQFTKIPNKWIPVILAFIGVGVSVWDNWGAVTSNTILIGLASGWAACAAYDTYKHFFVKGKDTDEHLTDEDEESEG